MVEVVKFEGAGVRVIMMVRVRVCVRMIARRVLVRVRLLVFSHQGN